MAIQSRRRSVDGTGRLCGAELNHDGVPAFFVFVVADRPPTAQKSLDRGSDIASHACFRFQNRKNPARWRADRLRNAGKV
jgi:hypothetical protein